MKRLAMACALLVGLLLTPLALAQQDPYRLKLSDIMTTIQMRHIKLWFAGKLQNWELAAYEAEQIKTSLGNAAELYREIPVNYVADTVEPLRAIRDALEAKDEVRFAKAFGDLTATCNACHQVIGRAFIVMQVPTASPFSNQSFSPRGRE